MKMRTRMVRRKSRRDDEAKPCPMPGCWNNIQVGGLCSADYSWWLRVQLFTGRELADYLEKRTKQVNRFQGRFSSQQDMRRGEMEGVYTRYHYPGGPKKPKQQAQQKKGR